MDFRPAFKALADRLEADLSDVVRRVTRQNLPARAFPDQPALVVIEDGVTPVRADGAPVAWELSAILVLHSQIGGEDEAPGTSLLELIERIDGALQWKPGERLSEDGYSTTLGGVVEYARLGDVQIGDDPDRASQVSTVMTVAMLVMPQGE